MKTPESLKKCIAILKILLLTSKVVFFSESNNSRDVRFKSFIFLNSTLISKILLRKLDWTKARFWQYKRLISFFNSSTARTHSVGSAFEVIPYFMFLKVTNI